MGMWGNVLVLTICLFSFVFFFKQQKFKYFVLTHYTFFLLLIFLCILGMWRMSQYSKEYEKYETMDVGDMVTVSGEITEIKKNEYGYIIVVKSGKFLHYVYNDDVSDVEIGFAICVNGKILEMKEARNPGGFNQKEYFKSLGVATKLECCELTILQKSRNDFKIYIEDIKESLCNALDNIATQKEAGILKAMVFGEKSDMDDNVTGLYQGAGVSHILCISGLHISVFGSTLFLLLRKKFSYYSASVISMCVMISFAILTGSGISSKRAVIMFGISLLAKVLGRKYDIKTSLMFTIFIMLYDMPFYLFSISFILSILAIAAIGFVYPVIWKFVVGIFRLENKSKTVNKVISTIFITISINITTLPIVAYTYFEIPTYSLIINMLIVPLMSVLVWLALIAVLTSFISVFIGKFFVGSAVYILRLYEWLCEINENMPFSKILVKRPELVTIALYYVLLCIGLVIIYLLTCKNGLYSRISERISNGITNHLLGGVFMILVGITLMMFYIILKKDTESLITFLDVGQGDCALVNMGDVRVLVDGGSSDMKNIGEYQITPCMKSMGYDFIDIVIVSHTDKDHISGIKDIIENELLKIGTVIIGGADDSEEYLSFVEMLEENNIDYKVVKKGDVIKKGDLVISVLHPYVGYVGDSNGSSLVVYVKGKEMSALFTGDISKAEEEEILMAYKDLIGDGMVFDVDVLKVAHHGSKNSSSKNFLETVKPDIAVISCGKKNSYGHPHKETLKNLEEVGVEIVLTPQAGAVIIRRDGVEPM